MKKKVMAIAVTATLFVFNTAQAGLFDTDEFFEKECLELFKKTHHINALVKAEDVEKTATNKYDFTPVMIVRGEKTTLIRQYCEHYPEEKMVYIGVAKSVVDARKNKEIEDARRKIIVDKKRAEEEASAAKHAAELQEIKDQAAAAREAELRFIKDQNARAAIKKQEQIKKDNEELKKQYLATAESCVSNDKTRVKVALLSALPSIHRPGAIHIEDQKISNMKFSESIMEVSYSFKIYTQSKFGNSLGSKGEPLNLKNTKDIDVQPYRRSTATAICKIERV